MTETEAQNTDLDLFGQPCLPIRDRRGRPSYAKNKENQELVSLLIAAGWTQERVAGYIGCDPKTLRKHFFPELQNGSDQIEAMALQVCLAKMKEGHAPAINRILDVIEQGRAVPPPPPEPKKPQLGKKATLEQKAGQPTGKWRDVLQ